MASLFLFANNASGHGAFLRKKEKILARLKAHYDEIFLYVSPSIEEGSRALKEAAKNYDVILIIGGDGTFHHALNALAEEPRIPPLGYLPSGTLNDLGKGFGISRNIDKALSAFLTGKPTYIDIGKINGHYFAYMASCGAFSDIAYSVSSKVKKRLKRFAYYPLSFHEALHKTRLDYSLQIEGEKIQGSAPFIMFMNHRYVGGFPVNKKGGPSDGKMELFLTGSAAFNGLWNYVFSRKKNRVLQVANAHLELPPQTPWCLDGEKMVFDSIDFSLISNRFQLILPQNK